MRLTRRELLAGAAGSALGAAGIYELVDRLSGSPVRSPARALPPEPHLLQSVRVGPDNDAAVLLRSDSLDHVAAGAKVLFKDLDLFRPQSIRRGFAGGGFEGRQSLPKKMALAAGVRGAELIPDTAELFLGFTSTQKAG